MEAYQEKAPVCDQEVLNKIKDIFVEQGIDRELLDKIEAM